MVVASPVDIVLAVAHLVAPVPVVCMDTANRLLDKRLVVVVAAVQVVGSPAHTTDRWVVAGKWVDSRVAWN